MYVQAVDTEKYNWITNRSESVNNLADAHTFTSSREKLAIPNTERKTMLMGSTFIFEIFKVEAAAW